MHDSRRHTLSQQALFGRPPHSLRRPSRWTPASAVRSSSRRPPPGRSTALTQQTVLRATGADAGVRRRSPAGPRPGASGRASPSAAAVSLLRRQTRRAAIISRTSGGACDMSAAGGTGMTRRRRPRWRPAGPSSSSDSCEPLLGQAAAVLDAVDADLRAPARRRTAHGRARSPAARRRAPGRPASCSSGSGELGSAAHRCRGVHPAAGHHLHDVDPAVGPLVRWPRRSRSARRPRRPCSGSARPGWSAAGRTPGWSAPARWPAPARCRSRRSTTRTGDRPGRAPWSPRRPVAGAARR